MYLIVVGTCLVFPFFAWPGIRQAKAGTLGNDEYGKPAG
jgi:hypothetical protein